MNRTILLLVFVYTFLISCSENKIDYTKALKGKWINKAYLEVVKKNKSPFKTFNTEIAKQIISVEYPSEKKGKLKVSYIHEGSNYSFKLNDSGEIVIFNDDSRNNKARFYGKLSIFMIDTVLSFKNRNDEGKIDFIKTNRRLDKTLDAVLIAGEYHLIQSKDNKEVIILNADGKVQGFNGFNNYSIIYDYNDNIPQYDIISFSTENTDRVWYSYKIRGDTLNLFEFANGYINLDYESQKMDTVAYSLLKLK